MKEPYGEGVASHTDPESCGLVREGRDEALTGARASRVLSREILLNFGVPTSSPMAEGNTGDVAIARRSSGSARSKTPCVHGNSSHGTREILRSTSARWLRGPRCESIGARHR